MPAPAASLKKRILTGIIVGAIAIALGTWAASQLLQQQVRNTRIEGATRFPEARELQPFSLADHTGKVFDKQALKGHWSFIFFGYTHCPDVCPGTLSVLNSVARRLADSGDMARFIMVSVDPARDDAEKLGNFVRYFNGDFIGVTGEPAALAELTGQLGIVHQQVAGTTGSGDYLVDHTASVFLFDPDGRYHAIFSPPFNADTMAASFRQMQQAWR